MTAARSAGFRVGVHYNLKRWDEIPQASDPGYVPWYQQTLREELRWTEADFVLLDGVLKLAIADQ